MKNRFNVVSLMAVALLVFGVVGVASADNATQVIVEISYPYGQDAAVSGAAAGDTVNVYVTLKDANGNPATAGPGGGALSTVTATLSTTLGLAGAITANSFVADALQLNFDTPPGSGPAARAQVNYTGSSPGVDQLIVSVPLDPTPIIGTADVRVVAADAQALAVRTYRNGSPSSIIYTPIDPQQVNGGGATETAGTAVPFWVIADDGAANYTFAPNVQGLVANVTAWADFNGNGQIDATGPEATPIGTGTATFANGIAQGTITINNGSPFTGSPLGVALTANVVISPTVTIRTNETLPVPAADPSVDLVPMLSQATARKLLIGGTPGISDPFGNGNLIVPLSSCQSILDDNATAATLTVFLADSLGNAVLAAGPIAVNASLGAGSTLETHPIDDSTGLPPAAGTLAWDIAPGNYLAVDILADGSGAANDAGTVVPGTLTLTATGLTQAQAALNLLPSDGPGNINMAVATDADNLGVGLAAGSTIEITISDPAGAGYLPIVNGDVLLITATGPAGDQLLSTVAGGFPSATTDLIVTAIDEDPATTPDIEISVVIYGPATLAGQPVVVTVADASRCDVSADNAGTDIDDIEPGPAQFLDITGVDGQTADDLNADPVVITSPIVADGATVEDVLAGDGVTNEAQEIDEFGNVTNAAPNFAAVPVNGLCVLGIDPGDLLAPAGIILTTNCVASAAGQTETIAITTTPAGLSRDIQLSNLVASATGPTGVATALVELQEGPTNVDGIMISPEAGGEAIFRVSANGSGTINRNIQIDFGEGTVEGAELRSLNGTTLTTPYTATLNFIPTLQDIRLVVSAPAAGCVTIVATDLSGTPLNPATFDLGFDAPCGGAGDCEVAISPAAALILPGDSLTFTAETTCDGVVQALAAAPNYTWAISEAGCTGGSIDAATGTYTAGAEDDACADTIMVTDTANGSAEATAVVNVSTELPSVSISGPATVGPPCPASATYTATTEVGGSTIAGTYTWELDGVSSGTGNTGNTFEVDCTETGTKTLTVTDTANGDITDSLTITCECEVGPTISIDATFQGCGRAFLPGFGIVTIQGTGTNFSLFNIVQYDAIQVIKGLKLTNRNNQTITQFVLLLPSFGPFLPALLPEYPITVEVTVAGVSDTFDIPSCR